MCKPISLILSRSHIYYPPLDFTLHSHEQIAKQHHLTPGLFSDRFARVEVTPPDQDFRHPDGSPRTDVENWHVVLDEERTPGWWADDAAHHEERARRAAQRYMERCADHIIPGYSTILPDHHSLLVTTPYARCEGRHDVKIHLGDHSLIKIGSCCHVTAWHWATVEGGTDNLIHLRDHAVVRIKNVNRVYCGQRSTIVGGHNNLVVAQDHATIHVKYNNTVMLGRHSEAIVDDGSRVYAEDRSIVLPHGKAVILFQDSNTAYKPLVVDTTDPETPPGLVYEFRHNKVIQHSDHPLMLHPR